MQITPDTATSLQVAPAQVGAGRTVHYVRVDGFHANAECGRTVRTVLADRDAAAMGRECTNCVKAVQALAAQAAYEAERDADALEPYTEAGRCTPMAGGTVHEMQHDPEDGRPVHVFPLCRTGAQTNAGTKYRKVADDTPLTCSNCVANAERRETYRARRAAARQSTPAAPAPAPVLTEDAALVAALQVYPEARSPRPVRAFDGALVAYTFRTAEFSSAGCGWVRADGTVADTTGDFHDDVARIALDEHYAAVRAARADRAAARAAAAASASLRDGVGGGAEDGVEGTWFVTAGTTPLGTVQDEGRRMSMRGRFCAWVTAGGSRRDGNAGFHDTLEAAAAAIVATHPAGQGTLAAAGGETPAAPAAPRTVRVRVTLATSASTTVDLDVPEGATAEEVAELALARNDVPRLCRQCEGGEFGRQPVEVGDDWAPVLVDGRPACTVL